MSEQEQNTRSWRDANVPEGHEHQSRVSWSFFQWVNGKGELAHPVLGKGGFAVPLDQTILELDGVGKWLHGIRPHSDGTETECYFASYLHLAVLATRRFWFDPKDRWARPCDYFQGARGKFQSVVYVRQMEGLERPMMLTCTGTAAKFMRNAFETYWNKVLPRAARLAKRKLPSYMFWIRIAPSEPMQPNKNYPTTVTPPQFVGPNLKDQAEIEKFLDGNYVGDEMLAKCIEVYDEAREWASQLPGQFRKEQVRETGYSPDEPPPDYVEEEKDIPF